MGNGRPAGTLRPCWNPKGFVFSGTDATDKLRPLETRPEGDFAIGDMRSGSVKRVAAAVGEGAQVVGTLHAYLATAERRIE
jgi:thioredoxin reductase (NADPH)